MWKKLFMRDIDNTKAAEEAKRILEESKPDKIRIVSINGRTYRVDNNYSPARIEEITFEILCEELKEYEEETSNEIEK